MTVSGIDPILERTLNETLQNKQFTGNWVELIPSVKTRIRQILASHYDDCGDLKSSEHILNINTNIKESKPDEKGISSMIDRLENLINERFKESPPFTIFRISELLLFDSFPPNQVSTKTMYENSPFKFLRALWLSFNVVTTLEEFDKRNRLRSDTTSTVSASTDAPAAPNNDDDKVKILPIQTERGGETKTVVMTRISWLNEVDDDDEDDDDDYVAGEEDDDSGSESDITDNDNESQQSVNAEEDEAEDAERKDLETLKDAKNPQVGKLIDGDISVNSPKNKKEQLNSPNIKRRKSDININIKEAEENDVSMTSIGEEEVDEKETSKDDIRMKDTIIDEEELIKDVPTVAARTDENLAPEP